MITIINQSTTMLNLTLIDRKKSLKTNKFNLYPHIYTDKQSPLTNLLQLHIIHPLRYTSHALIVNLADLFYLLIKVRVFL